MNRDIDDDRIDGDAFEGAERARRRKVLWLTLLLLIGLPIYLILAASILGQLTQPQAAGGGEIVKPLHWLVELFVYIGLGVVWALPLRGLVAGVGRVAPVKERDGG